MKTTEMGITKEQFAEDAKKSTQTGYAAGEVKPTSDRWIKMDENTTIITTALTNITSIIRNGNDVAVYCGHDNCESVFSTTAVAEAFLDEILAKIDRL